MKIILEDEKDPLIKTKVYTLSSGTHKVRYGKLEDALLRVALLFEPPEEKKPRVKREKREKKQESFPIGQVILEVLQSNPVWLTVDQIIRKANVPKKFVSLRKSSQIWSMSLARLCKQGRVQIEKRPDGNRYTLMRKSK